MSEESISNVEYEGKTYSLKLRPSQNTGLVVEQKSDMKKTLRLEELGKDFSSLGKFLRLAHYGVVGHTDLQIEVRKTLDNVVNLCDDTVHTVNEFDRACESALENMQSAYEYLEEDLEEEAIETLKEVIAVSEKMREAADKLHMRCKEEAKNVHIVGDVTIQKRGKVSEKIEQAKVGIKEQKIDQKYQEGIITDEEHAAKNKTVEIKDTYEDKQSIFLEKEELLKDEEQQLQALSEQKQQKIDKLKSTLEIKLIEVKSNLNAQLCTNEKEYKSMITQNEDELNANLEENKATLEKRQQKIQKVLKECEEKNIETYQEKLNSTSLKSESTLQGEISTMTSKEEAKLAGLVADIEKKYVREAEEIEFNYKAEVERIKANFNQELIKNQEKFEKMEEIYQQQYELTIRESNEVHSSKEEKAGKAYANAHVSENDAKERIKRLEESYKDEVAKIEMEYNQEVNEIEMKHKETLEEEEKAYHTKVHAIEAEDKKEYNQLKELKGQIINKPVAAQPSLYGRAKTFFTGNEEEKRKQQEQLEAAEAADRLQKLHEKNYNENKDVRNKQKDQASAALEHQRQYHEDERKRRLCEASGTKLRRIDAACNQKDNLIKVVQQEKRDTEAKLNTLSKIDEERSSANISAMNKRTKAIENAKECQTTSDIEVEHRRNEAYKDAETKRKESINKAEYAKTLAIQREKELHESRVQQLTVSMKAENQNARIQCETEARNIRFQADENAKNKYNCDVKQAEEQKLKDDVKTRNDKANKDDKALETKQLNDKVANETAGKEINELKKDYDQSINKLDSQEAADKARIQEEIQKKLANLTTKFDELKEHEERLRKEHEEHEQRRREAKIKIAKAARNIANFQDQVEVREESKECLDHAVFALNHIEDIMKQTSRFWNETGSVCRSVTDHGFGIKVAKLTETKGDSKRRKVFTSKTFKKQALKYYGQWVALKNICNDAGNYLKLANDEVHQYARENPKEAEARKMVKELADALTEEAKLLSIEDSHQ